MSSMRSGTAALPPGRCRAVSLLWRALVALTLLLTSSRRLAEAQQRNGTTAGQEEALLQFKAAFPGWRAAFAKHRLGGWEPAAAPGSSGPCSWSFVECDAAGDVTKLELSQAALKELGSCGSTDQSQCRVALKAELPTLTQPLSRLPALRHLTLSGLGLTGRLPPDWRTALPALQTLDLSGNALTGGMPASWIALGAWQALTALDLSHNPLGGALPNILPADFNATATRTAVQSWIDHIQPTMAPPPPLRKLMLSGCQLNGSLPWDWPLLQGLALLWLDDNQLGGTMPPSWGTFNDRAGDVRDLNLWSQGISVQLQRNQLHGPVACCEVKMMVQPGNEGMCLPTSGTIRVEPKRAPHIPVLYTRQVCSATPGQATYCSTQPATLPVCGDQPAGKQLRWASSHGSAVAGGLAVAAGGVFAVAAAAAAVGLRRRCCRRRRRAVQTSSNWDAELANLLPHPGFQQQQQQQAGIAVTAAGSKPPSTRSGGSSKGAGSASSADGSGERLGPRSSWHLHSRSLQLQVDDFQILLDKSGRPDLLGSGASSRVYRGLLHGSQPVAIKVMAPAAACRLLDPASGSPMAPSSMNCGGQEQQQQQQHERRMWREVELLRQCRHPCLVQLLGVFVSPGGGGGAPAQQQRRLMLVTELMQGGSLSGRLGEAQLRWHRCGSRVALDVARALAFLHHLGIAHRDVKSANILLTTRNLPDARLDESMLVPLRHGSSSSGVSVSGVSGSSRSGEHGFPEGDGAPQLEHSAAPLGDGTAQMEHSAACASLADGGAGQLATKADGSNCAEASSAPLAKLGDVGLARALDQASLSLAGGGTILYAAPEQLANSTPGLAADMFSLAWVIHEIATGERLLRRGQGRPLRAPEDCPDAIVQLVESCLQLDPSARPTAAEAVAVIATSLAAAQGQPP